jgi:hypothetical protein
MTDADNTFEVLLSLQDNRGETRWFIDSVHPTAADARAVAGKIMRAPGAGAVRVMIVRSVWDETAGIFRDRVIFSQGGARSWRRMDTHEMDPSTRQRVLTALTRSGRAAARAEIAASGQARTAAERTALLRSALGDGGAASGTRAVNRFAATTLAPAEMSFSWAYLATAVAVLSSVAWFALR